MYVLFSSLVHRRTIRAVPPASGNPPWLSRHRRRPCPHLALRHGAPPTARLARDGDRLLRFQARSGGGRNPQPGRYDHMPHPGALLRLYALEFPVAPPITSLFPAAEIPGPRTIRRRIPEPKAPAHTLVLHACGSTAVLRENQVCEIQAAGAVEPSTAEKSWPPSYK